MLPYARLEDAEMALGRNLTFAETIWYNYSARKSDYVLYCHNTLFLFVFYMVVPLPMVMMELMRSNKIDQFKIQPKVKNSFADMFECCRKVLLTFVLAVGPLQLFSFPVIQDATEALTKAKARETAIADIKKEMIWKEENPVLTLILWIGIRTSLPLPSFSEVFWQILVYFLLEDYANYWLHRMLHSEWGYEKIHHVHHEYTAPIGFAAPYAHPAEIIILGFASFLGPLIVPGHMITFWLWMILRQIEAIETHCGYEFPWSPSKYIPFYGGAIYHDYHHFVGGSSHSNFASVFTYCDYIYGTDKGYRYQKEVLEKARKKLRSESEDSQKEYKECLKSETGEEPKMWEQSEKPSMTEQPDVESRPKKLNKVLPRILVDCITKASSSLPSSPIVQRKLSSRKKYNCLCAPTKHSGSFRCRHHRNVAGLSRGSMSVGSKLFQLANTN